MTVEALSLFGTVPHPRARATDTGTALSAARSITPGRTEQRILDAYRQVPRHGMTDDELAVALAPMYPATVKTARSRLLRAGLLRDSGKRRPSARGRDQIVWVLAPANPMKGDRG